MVELGAKLGVLERSTEVLHALPNRVVQECAAAMDKHVTIYDQLKVVPHFEYSVRVRAIFGGRTCGGFLPQRLLRFVSRHRAHSLKNALVMRLWALCLERSS